MRLFVGDDWAEDHHDVEVMNEAGKVLAKRRLPEGVAGIAQLHELVGRYLPEDAEDAEVAVGSVRARGARASSRRLHGPGLWSARGYRCPCRPRRPEGPRPPLALCLVGQPPDWHS
jgi:hypothetical protein